MKATIETIIRNEIRPGCIFDAHTIIDYLIQNHTDVYLAAHQNNWTTEYYHSAISRMIDEFGSNLIERLDESWSRNIHMNYTENACWRKK